MDDSKKLPKDFLNALNKIKSYFNKNSLLNYNLSVNPQSPYLVIKNYNENSYFKIVDFTKNTIGKIFPTCIYKSPFFDAEEIVKPIEFDAIIEPYTHWLHQLKEYDDFIELHDSLFPETLIKKTTSEFSSDIPNLLPICLKQLQVKNFFSIQSTEIIDIPENTQWVFLIGENGYGKTLILQSIFIGLFGNVDDDKILAKDQVYEILVEYNEGLKNNKVAHINNIINTSFSEKLKKLVAIGASRLNLANESASEVTEKSTASYSLFKTDGLLLNIDKELENLAIKSGNLKFEIIKRCIIQLLHPYLNQIEYDKHFDCILYYEQDEENLQYKAVKFDSLASGFKSIIGMAGDIIIRLSKHQEIKDISDLEGIVLIDEFDLHLHPKFQIEAVKAFTKVFPKIQFIVSTHSPMPLLGAPLTSQVYKICRNKEQGVYIEKMEVDLKKLTPNLILTSPIFDLDSISNVNATIDDVNTEDDYDELQKNEAIDEFLNKRENIKKKYPDSIFS